MLQSRESDSLMRNRRSFPVQCRAVRSQCWSVRLNLRSNEYWKAMQINEPRLGNFWIPTFAGMTVGRSLIYFADFSSRALPPHLRQARVQGIAQRVAEKIEAHQGKENEEPRQENLERSDKNIGCGVGQ
jgi:hypothetical protein